MNGQSLDYVYGQAARISPMQSGVTAAPEPLWRRQLAEGGLDNVEVILRQQPKVDGPNHFGGRLAFAPDGKLFITLGERFKFTPAQDLSNDLGKMVRINPDGSVPPDNPFVGKSGAGQIWTYGHRNPQGLAFNPKTGKLFESEFGPKGGDEINVLEPGKNYGWPMVSWGSNYDGTPIPPPTTHPEFAAAIAHWNPVISPSGIAFYTGNAIPGWKDNLLIAGLSCRRSLGSLSMETTSPPRSASRWVRAFATSCRAPTTRCMRLLTCPTGLFSSLLRRSVLPLT